MCLHVGKGGEKTDNSSYFTYITSFNMMSVFTHEVIEAQICKYNSDRSYFSAVPVYLKFQQA